MEMVGLRGPRKAPIETHSQSFEGVRHRPQGSADTLFRVDDFERGRTCRWGTVME
jgi:hypothetical protein